MTLARWFVQCEQGVQERLTGLLTHRQAGNVPSVQRTETIVTDWPGRVGGGGSGERLVAWRLTASISLLLSLRTLETEDIRRVVAGRPDGCRCGCAAACGS